jgi:hypothetical protein
MSGGHERKRAAYGVKILAVPASRMDPGRSREVLDAVVVVTVLRPELGLDGAQYRAFFTEDWRPWGRA